MSILFTVDIIMQMEDGVINCPDLRKLSVRGLCVKSEPLYFDLLLRPLPGIGVSCEL